MADYVYPLSDLSMRFVFLIGFICVPLLSGCIEQPLKSTLPPDEVLRRAVQSSVHLESAEFDVSGSFTWKDPLSSRTEGTFGVFGVLQDFGKQVQMNATIDAVSTTTSDTGKVRAVLDIINAGQDQLYLRVQELSSEADLPLFRSDLVENFRGKWLMLHDESRVGVPTDMTPDPRLITAQAQVVKVLNDRGMVTINGREMYHYDTEIDPMKLQEYLHELQRNHDQESATTAMNLLARGQLWIDAQTYFVHGIQWTLSPFTTESGQVVSGTFEVLLQNHNRAPSITIPYGTDVIAPLQMYDAPGLGDAVDTYGLPPGFDEEVMKQLFQMQGQNSYTIP